MKLQYRNWTVIGKVDGDRSRLLCRCICGADRAVLRSNLSSGASSSCGCSRDRPRPKPRKSFLEYSPWKAMRARCNNPNHKNYDRYGGRGISVCERWNDFDNFLEDMGPRPTDKHSIDRIDSQKNYEPGNCRWATQSEQMENTCRSVHTYWHGRRVTVREASALSGLRANTIYHRLKAGWGHEAAVSNPLWKRQ